jgi:hypothetical protein
MAKRERSAQRDQVLNLAQRRAFMTLSLKERRKMLAAQAERMLAYYEQESEQSEREARQGVILANPSSNIHNATRYLDFRSPMFCDARSLIRVYRRDRVFISGKPYEAKISC